MRFYAVLSTPHCIFMHKIDVSLHKNNKKSKYIFTFVIFAFFCGGVYHIVKAREYRTEWDKPTLYFDNRISHKKYLLKWCFWYSRQCAFNKVFIYTIAVTFSKVLQVTIFLDSGIRCQGVFFDNWIINPVEKPPPKCAERVSKHQKWVGGIGVYWGVLHIK